MLNLKPLFKRTFIKLFKIEIMKKLTDFLVSMALAFTKPYLMLIIYNKFIAELLSMPNATYIQMFFLSMFSGLLFGSISKTLKNVMNTVNKKEDSEYLTEYIIASISLLLVFWLNIFLLKYLF